MSETLEKENRQLKLVVEQLTGELAAATTSLGRLTVERDQAVQERDRARGEVIVCQQARARGSREGDQLRKTHAEAIAAAETAHRVEVGRLQDAMARANTQYSERLRDKEHALAEATKRNEQLAGELARTIALLERYAPQIRADQAAAELVEIEKKESDLAKRKAALQESMQPARLPAGVEGGVYQGVPIENPATATTPGGAFTRSDTRRGFNRTSAARSFQRTDTRRGFKGGRNP